jgi:hypothetical protein
LSTKEAKTMDREKIEFTAPTLPAPILENVWKAVKILKKLEKRAIDYNNIMYEPECERELEEIYKSFDDILMKVPEAIRQLEIKESERGE